MAQPHSELKAKGEERERRGERVGRIQGGAFQHAQLLPQANSTESTASTTNMETQSEARAISLHKRKHVTHHQSEWSVFSVNSNTQERFHKSRQKQMSEEGVTRHNNSLV